MIRRVRFGLLCVALAGLLSLTVVRPLSVIRTQGPVVLLADDAYPPAQEPPPPLPTPAVTLPQLPQG